MFRDREDGAMQLANLLRTQPFLEPLVLAIPRGGVATGAVLARELGAELDVILSRKLRAPGQKEAAIGAIAEDGRVYLNPDIRDRINQWSEYLAEERNFQSAEIERRKQLFRKIRPRAKIAGRSVIVTDDGIATGTTMIAALQLIRTQHPKELIVAVPVGSPERLKAVRRYCDNVVCVVAPEDFWAVGQYYEDFSQIEDDQVVELLREANRPSSIRQSNVII
jgi:putative phosphoribosyl transferase